MLHTYIYRSMMLLIHIDQTLELTVMSIVCSIVILYDKYLANASHGPVLEQKMFRDQTEVTLFRPGTVPVPVLVLVLVI